MKIASLVLLALALTAAACAKPAATTSDTFDDQTITMRVKTAFINDPVIGVARVDVETFKGVVTLSGRVRSKEEEAKAIALARTMKGVTDVQSKLQVAGDQEIKRD
jgi:osmotically-inducible protein OsmY